MEELEYDFAVGRRRIRIQGRVEDVSTAQRIRFRLRVNGNHIGTFERNPNLETDQGRTKRKVRGTWQTIGSGNLLAGVLLLEALRN